MKALLSLILATTFVSSLACAENFSLANTNKATRIIAAAVEAHGGPALLNDLHTLIVESETVSYSVDQSLGTQPPWDRNDSSSVDVIDLDESVYLNVTQGSGGGYQNHTATIINGRRSHQLDYRAGTAARIAEPDFATASGPFVRVTPALLIRRLNERAANAHYLGETDVGGVTYEVVGFSMTVGPAISLYFHKQTHLLHRSERVLPGFGLVEYEFIDYEDANGVPFNQAFKLYLNGEENIERSIRSMKVNASIDEYLEVDAALLSIPAIEPDPLARQEIVEGVWLIGGSGTYAMFVDMGEYIFAAGGTAGIAARIELLREVVGDKPLKYSMMTHHHFDHVLGVAVYESEGATVVGSASHEKIIRGAAKHGDTLNFEAVTDSMTLETSSRRVDVLDLGATAHTEHLLVAYLPEEGILFEADHFSMPRVGPVPPAQMPTRTFAEALARKDLKVTKILSAHSPRAGTMEDLHTALGTETAYR